jgi:hypothetical protein
VFFNNHCRSLNTSITLSVEELQNINKTLERRIASLSSLETVVREKSDEIDALNKAVNDLQNAMEEMQLSKENEVRIEVAQLQTQLSMAQQRLRDINELETRVEVCLQENVIEVLI